MDLKEFLTALEKTPRDWYLADGVRLRRPKRYYGTCPICAVAGKPGEAWWDTQVVKKTLGESIAAAADLNYGADRLLGTLRRRLLEACGLEEKE